MGDSMNLAAVAALQKEHTLLDREIADWRAWWRELSEMGIPHFGEMGDRLTRFRDHLAAHFAHEEQQGCLPVVIGLPAGSVKQMAELRDDHSPMLAELDRLIARLQACEPDFGSWRNARQDFEAVLDRLNQHEQAEDHLLDQLP